MANTRDEYEAAEATRKAIMNADTDREALLHAFDGLGTLLITVLQELRETREAAENA